MALPKKTKAGTPRRLGPGMPGPYIARLALGHPLRRGAKSANVKMIPMAKTQGSFRAAVLIGWMALGVAGVLYARLKGIPSWAAVPVLAAFLVEYPFYLVPAFPALRERFAGARLPLFLLASTVLPYLVCCCGAIEFHWLGLVRLAALSVALGLWYGSQP